MNEDQQKAGKQDSKKQFSPTLSFYIKYMYRVELCAELFMNSL